MNVAKVREDENEWKEFKSRYSINSTPTFTVYREGSIEKLFWTKESGMSLAEVEEFWIMLVCNSKGVLIMKI